jgi:CxxC motif-containing protein
MANREIICINCPIGCRIDLSISDSGEIEATGFQCKIGKEYAVQEYRDPRRVLTTTIRTESNSRPVLPVRSKGTIPRDRLKDCVEFLSRLKVKAPLQAGEVVVSDMMGTGVEIICTDDLE